VKLERRSRRRLCAPIQGCSQTHQVSSARVRQKRCWRLSHRRSPRLCRDRCRCVSPAPGARRTVPLPCPTSRNGTPPPGRSLGPLCRCRLANLNSLCPRVLSCAPRRDDCDYVRRITGDLQRTLNEIVQNNRMSVDTTRLSGQFRKGLKELDTALVELDESLEYAKQQKAMYAGAASCGRRVRLLAHAYAGPHELSPPSPRKHGEGV